MKRKHCTNINKWHTHFSKNIKSHYPSLHLHVLLSGDFPSTTSTHTLKKKKLCVADCKFSPFFPRALKKNWLRKEWKSIFIPWRTSPFFFVRSWYERVIISLFRFCCHFDLIYFYIFVVVVVAFTSRSRAAFHARTAPNPIIPGSVVQGDQTIFRAHTMASFHHSFISFNLLTIYLFIFSYEGDFIPYSDPLFWITKE